MGYQTHDYKCPGCAENINIGTASQCPLCETPVTKYTATNENSILCPSCKAAAPLEASTCPECGRVLASRGFWILVPVISLFAIAVFGILAAIAIPNFKKASEKANKRACFANQKVIAGGVEMYNLDFNTNVRQLDSSLFNKLKQEGYLQNIPHCPGKKTTSMDGASYSMDPTGEITCKIHGHIQGRKYQVEK